jgi:hypothetical protein
MSGLGRVLVPDIQLSPKARKAADLQIKKLAEALANEKQPMAVVP